MELESRAGMQTVTVECLTGMLQKESEADPDDDTESVLLSARARQVGGVAVPLLQGLKKRVGGNTMAIGTFPTHDLDIDPDDSDDSGTATVDDGDDTGVCVWVCLHVSTAVHRSWSSDGSIEKNPHT